MAIMKWPGMMWAFAATGLIALAACQAKGPGSLETLVAEEAKKVAISGKNVPNPLPDNAETIAQGKEHFQHHCSICHGMDGRNTGVPFADKMSPPVADLSQKNVQEYTDGQLKAIIENGLRFTGMPGWKGILDDNEMWAMTRFLRHLPEKGSEGIPEVFKEEQEQHEKAEQGSKAGGEHKHTHSHSHEKEPR